jgi:hypothetical protein
MQACLQPRTFLRGLVTVAGACLLATPSVAQPPQASPPAAPREEITLEEVRRESAIAQASEPAEETELVPLPALDQDIWAGTLELYGYLPLQTNIYSTIRGREFDSEASLADLLAVLKFAGSGRASVEKGRVGVLLDAYYTRVGGEDTTLVGPNEGLRRQASLDYTQGFYDLALRYRFGPRESAVGEAGQVTLIPYAGARLIDLRWDVNASLDFLPRTVQGPRGNSFDLPGRTLLAVNRTVSRTWVQPLVGVWGTYFLTPRLKAFGRADIAGFDLAGEDDISYNLQAGLGYAIGNSTDLNLSWRTLGLSWNNGNDPDNGYRSYNYGIEAAVKFFFGGRPPMGRIAARPPEPAPQPAPEPEPAPMPEPFIEPVRGLW